MAEMFGLDNFDAAARAGENPVVSNKIKSLGTFIKRVPVQKWKNPEGRIWRAPNNERRKPTNEEIKTQKLEKFTYSHFGTYPAWSLGSLMEADILPVEYKESAERLLDLRRNKAQEFNPEDSLHTMVKNYLDSMIERMGIKVIDDHEAAFYVAKGAPDIADSIRVPHWENYSNPIQALSVGAHELAHSTMHLLERNASLVDSSKAAYRQRRGDC